MTASPTKNLTFEEYLIYDDGTDNRYELVDGELVMVPLPTADHSDEIDLLLEVFRAEISRQKIPRIAKRDVGVYIGKSPKTGRDYSRLMFAFFCPRIGQNLKLKKEQQF